MNPRVFIAGVYTVAPDLPDDLLGAYDIHGVRWHRNFSTDTGGDTFSPERLLPDDRLPSSLDWTRLLNTRGPLAESPAVGFLT